MELNAVLLSFTLMGAEWVLYLLVVLSVLSVAVMAERAVYLLATRSDLDLIEEALETLRPGDSIQEARADLASLRGSTAIIVRKSLERAGEGPAVVEEVVASLAGKEKLRLERGVAFLGTVGSNAPFIGLFGTVLGIIKAFHDLSRHPGGGAEVVMSGISEALVATAVGLMVAIPAVMAYNFLQRRIKQRISRINALAHLLLAGLKGTASTDERAPRQVRE